MGPLISDIRGTLDAMVFSCWKGVHYVRELATEISNPCSADQEDVRSRLTLLSRAWYDVLDQGQRDVWEEYAKELGSSTDSESTQGAGIRQVIPDNHSVMSGYNAFIMVNGWIYSAGILPAEEVLKDAPKGITPPNAPTGLSARCETTTATPGVTRVILTWTDPAEPPAFSIGRIRVWGMSIDAGVHRQLITTVPAGDETVPIDKVKGALGGEFDIIALPGHYLFQIDAVGGMGQKSPPSNVVEQAVSEEACPVTPP